MGLEGELAERVRVLEAALSACMRLLERAPMIYQSAPMRFSVDGEESRRVLKQAREALERRPSWDKKAEEAGKP